MFTYLQLVNIPPEKPSMSVVTIRTAKMELSKSQSFLQCVLMTAPPDWPWNIHAVVHVRKYQYLPTLTPRLQPHKEGML